jgi:DNA primase
MGLIVKSNLVTFLERILKESGRIRTGNNFQVHCPFCHYPIERKLELCLDPPFFWHCWHCDAKGRGFYTFLKKLNASRDLYVELESIVGKPINSSIKTENSFDPFVPSVGPEEKVKELQLPLEFASLSHNDGSRNFNRAMNYAITRKISSTDIVKYNIGFCSSGLYQDRLVFPSYDKNNKLNFFSARSYYDDSFMKYRNCDASKDIIGFENLIDFDYPIYLCEGALDAISLRRNAIPLFGKTISNALRIAISSSKCPEINIVLDDDALKSALNIAEFLTSIGKTIKLVRLKGKDPNVLGFDKTMEQIRNTEKLDFMQLMRLKLGI